VCCSVLQCAAGIAYALLPMQSVAVCVAVYHSVLQCVTVCCSVLQCVAGIAYALLSMQSVAVCVAACCSV